MLSIITVGASLLAMLFAPEAIASKLAPTRATAQQRRIIRVSLMGQ